MIDQDEDPPHKARILKEMFVLLRPAKHIVCAFWGWTPQIPSKIAWGTFVTKLVPLTATPLAQELIPWISGISQLPFLIYVRIFLQIEALLSARDGTKRAPHCNATSTPVFPPFFFC